MTGGVFITFEGVEGSGKSTQLVRLEQRLRAAGADVVATREPGGTDVGETIRHLLLDRSSEGLQPHAELMLYEAARAQLVAEVIRPALEDGTIVLCDRFYDSTTAYQGHARGIDPGMIAGLNLAATGGLSPDLTLVYDLPVDEGLRRATSGQAADRLESEDIAFHERVAEGFRAIATAEPVRVILIDAAGSVDDVFERTLVAVTRLPRVARALRPETPGEDAS
jgi:dTMP kinase